MTNTQHQISIVNVTDPAALPLQNGANANPLLVGVNFSLGMASVVSQLNTALGPSGLQFSNPPAGSTLLNIVRHRRGDGERGVDHDHEHVARQRHPAAAAVHRRQLALHRRNTRRPARR